MPCCHNIDHHHFNVIILIMITVQVITGVFIKLNTCNEPANYYKNFFFGN